MEKHTAGPWRFSYYGEVRAENNDVVARVAEYGTQSETPDAAIANARLIAAAPELLAALQEISERGPLDGYGSVSALRLRLVATQSIARAAISKATGN